MLAWCFAISCRITEFLVIVAPIIWLLGHFLFLLLLFVVTLFTEADMDWHFAFHNTSVLAASALGLEKSSSANCSWRSRGSCSKKSCSARKQHDCSPSSVSISSISCEGFWSPRGSKCKSLWARSRLPRPNVSRRRSLSASYLLSDGGCAKKIGNPTCGVLI